MRSSFPHRLPVIFNALVVHDEHIQQPRRFQLSPTVEVAEAVPVEPIKQR